MRIRIIMKLAELLLVDEYNAININGDIDIDNITTNQEQITKNTLFVLVRSINFDVSKIISYILSKRPAALIMDIGAEIKSDVPIIKVENARKILPHLLSRFYKIDYSKMRFVGVTGTNGKTTTARMLSEILTAAGEKVGFIGTGKIEIDGEIISDDFYSMTTPDADVLYKSIRQMQDSGCSFVVMEVSSHALFFEKTVAIPFEAAIFTNLSPEHSDFHKNMEDYYKTKLKIFENCKVGIFNSDDVYSARAKEEVSIRAISIGVLHRADIMAQYVELLNLRRTEYVYRDSKRIFKVILPLAGAYNIYNSMLAISAAIELGVRPCIAKAAIKNLKRIDGRFDIINDSHPTVIIDYAHTAEGLRNFLKTIKKLKNAEQKLILVFGCGGERDTSKRPVMGKISEQLADKVIITSDNSRTEAVSQIIEDILSGFTKTENRTVITSRRAAIFHAILSADDNDIIAVVGKGHEKYNIDEHGYHKFDERQIIAEALKKRKGQRNI